MEKPASSPKPLFLALGIFGLLFGLLHLFNLSAAPANIAFADTIFNTMSGVLALGVWFFIDRNFVIAAIIFVLEFLSSIVYGLAIGRGFNFIILAFGVYFGYRLYVYNFSQKERANFQETDE